MKWGEMMRQTKYKTGQLLVQLGNAVTHFRNQRLQLYNLTSSQAGVIGCLKKNKEQGITAGELAGEMNCAKATISQILKTMRKKDLVVCCDDQKDERKSRIFLTQRGRAQEKYLNRVIVESEEVVLRGMSEKEQEQLNTLLRIALNNINSFKMEGRQTDIW